MPISDTIVPLRPRNDARNLLDELAVELKRIRHGSIHLVIHEGRVVQLEITEKRRTA